MHLAQFERIMERRPFRRFSMVLGGGEQFEVTHPEQLVLSEQFIAFGIKQQVDFDTVKLVIYWIDLAHIAYLRRG